MHGARDDLFDEHTDRRDRTERIGDSAMVLRGFARSRGEALLEAIDTVTAAAPLRHLTTPGGYGMSVAMTNCGPLGWVSDRNGYRYSPVDPQDDRPWPEMPAVFARLADAAARAAGYPGMTPQACLINRYRPGSKLSLHQDRDETDMDSPIVSVSLGVPGIFLFGGPRRKDRASRLPLHHGDVVVWGGPSRLHYHGLATLRRDWHPLTGEARFNLTFRRVHAGEIQ